MDYITESEYKELRKKIQHYKKNCEGVDVPCAVCGKRSITFVWSMAGSIKFYMCKDHKSVGSYMGAGSMGITVNGEPHDMKYLGDQIEVLDEFKKQHP